MFKKNDTLRNVLLAGLACVALIFAGCNQAVDDGNANANANYSKLNDGNPVTASYAADAILNQQGGTISAKISNEGLSGGDGTLAKVGGLALIADAMKTNSSVMVELDLSGIWHDNILDSGDITDAFGGLVRKPAGATEEGSREIPNTSEGVVPNGLFTGLKNLVSINLPFTVTEIEEGAFSGCENLETVTINFFFVNDVSKLDKRAWEYMLDDVFLLKKIGANAFDGCANLKDFVLVSDPDNDDVDNGFPVSVQEIGDYAFRNCYSLENVKFVNTRNAGREVFFGTSSKDDPATLNWYDNEGVSRNTLMNYDKANANIGVYVYNAGELQTVSIGNAAFQNCKGIKTVDFTNKATVLALSDGEENAHGTTGVVATEAAIGDNVFDGCESLETIYFGRKVADLTAFNPYDIAQSAGTDLYPSEANTAVANPKFVKYGNYSFQRTALASETVAALLHASDALDNEPGASTEKDVVEFIGDRAFFGDAALEIVRLPSTITFAAENLGAGAFANTGVRYIELHNTSDFLSITEEFLADPDINWTTPAGKNLKPLVEKYWKGALIGGNVKYATPAVVPDYDDIATTFPTDIAFWRVIDSESEGNLRYLPPEESQNPRTKVLGSNLVNIWSDAFYKNVDVKQIMLPNGLMDPTEAGIGDYAFANAENLEYVGFEGDDDGVNTTEVWADGNQGVSAFANVPAEEVDLVITQTKGKLNK